MEYDFDQINDRKGTYSTQWDFTADRFQKKDLLPFSISDTDFIIPEPITNTIKELVEKRIYGYTRWNHHDYKSSIANYFNSKFEVTIDEDWVVYSPSVLYSISQLIKLLTNKEDAIVCFNPMYDSFFTVVTGNDRKLISNNLVKKNDIFKIDFSQLEKQLRESRLLLLCSPHNPTGRIWTEEEMNHIIRLCKKYDVSIISDEIHMDIQIGNRKNIPLLKYRTLYKKLYTCGSSSKTFNTPGLIGSYALIPDEDVRNAFLYQTRKVDFLNSPSIFGMYATMIGYQNCDDYTEQLCKYVKKNMQYLKMRIDKDFKDLSFTIPEATYLAWIDCTRVPFTSEEIQNALVNVGNVGIMKGETYGENGAKYLRMNLGCPRSKVEEGINRMKKSFDWLYKETQYGNVE